MEKTDKLIKGVGVLLFITMLAYLGYYAWNSITNSVQTALAVSASVTISTPVSGLIVREEATLTSSEPNLYITAQDGGRLAAGETAAIAYSDETALRRAGRIRELQLEISRVETALYGATSEDIAIQAEAVQEAVVSLSAAVARHELDGIDVCCLSLGSLVFGDTAGEATAEQLAGLKTELYGLLTNSTSDTREITTDRSGLFTTVVDGWEQLTIEDVRSITPETLRSLEEAEPSVPTSAYGKLVTSFTWYYAAVVAGEYAQELEQGSRVELNFGRGARGVSARVYSLGPADENGDRVAVFSCTSAQAETLALRKAQAEVVFSEYSGIRVPSSAIHIDGETGGKYVYVLTGLQAERKDITIVYEGEDFCLAAIEPEADALREGNEIITRARDIYDGKVMD